MAKFNRKLPSNEICLDMMKSGIKITDILKEYGIKGTSSKMLTNLANKNNVVINKRVPNRIIVDGVTIRTNRNDYIIQTNKYNEMDCYEKGQVIRLNGHSWTIQQVTGTIRKLYHCINEIGIRECYDALQIKGVNL